MNPTPEVLEAAKNVLEFAESSQRAFAEMIGGRNEVVDEIALLARFILTPSVAGDMPVTREWWMANTPHRPHSTYVEIDDVFGLILCNDSDVYLHAESEERNTDIYSTRLPHIKTVGDAINLLAALGIDTGGIVK